MSPGVFTSSMDLSGVISMKSPAPTTVLGTYNIPGNIHQIDKWIKHYCHLGFKMAVIGPNRLEDTDCSTPNWPWQVPVNGIAVPISYTLPNCKHHYDLNNVDFDLSL